MSVRGGGSGQLGTFNQDIRQSGGAQGYSEHVRVADVASPCFRCDGNHYVTNCTVPPSGANGPEARRQNTMNGIDYTSKDSHISPGLPDVMNAIALLSNK